MTISEINKTLDKINQIAEYAIAYYQTDERTHDAQEYCQKYLMPDSWGKNIWHAVLDDAIKMRRELENI